MWYIIMLHCTLIVFNFMNFISCMFFYIIPSLIILRIIDIKFNTSIAGLQTKGKFTGLVCGPKMKSRHSRSLGKEVFDE